MPEGGDVAPQVRRGSGMGRPSLSIRGGRRWKLHRGRGSLRGIRRRWGNSSRRVVGKVPAWDGSMVAVIESLD